jgi:hypothetical protein
MKKSLTNYYRTYFFQAFFFICLVFNTSFEVNSQELRVIATIDTNKLLIGDQTYFRITLEDKPGFTLEWPTIPDTLFKGFEIVKRFLPDTLINQKDRIKIQQKFLITSFDSGQHELPLMKLVISTGLQHDSIVSNPVSLWVNTLPIDTAKAIADIKKPYGAPITLKEVLPEAGIGLAGLLFLLLLIYIIRRLIKQKPLLPTRTIIELAHTRALRDLDLLKEEKLWQQGMVKQYYTRLTDIVRIYIEDRFDVPAMEQTSDEMLNSLKKLTVEDEASFAALKEILTLSDLVKFAKALPFPNENESNILNAYLFVNHTKEHDAPQTADNSKTSSDSHGEEVSHG